MLKKKGGTTVLFVILGLLILLLTFFAFRSVPGANRSIQTPSMHKEAIEGIVTSCFLDSGERAISLMGLHGGYIYPEENMHEKLAFSFSGANDSAILAFGLFDGEDLLLDDYGLTFQLNRFIEETSPACFHFERYPSLVVKEEVRVASTLFADHVEVRAEFPLELKSGDVSTPLYTEYRVSIFLPIKKLNDMAHAIVSQQMQYGGMIRLADLLSEGVSIKMVRVDEKTMIFILTDPKKSDFSFLFASAKGDRT